MIRVTFLGTSASRPTVGRNVSSIAVQREGELFLWDCGEGTQRQMMRYQTGFSLNHIFITHLHADHFLGLIGLLRTLSLQGRTDPLHLYGPVRSGGTLRSAVELGGARMSFPVEYHELSPGEGVDWPEFRIEALPVRHGVASLGYALREAPRPGRFRIEAARALGIPEGPLYGKLHRGEPVEVEGRWIDPQELVGPPRPARLVAYSGDTRPCEELVEAVRGADLLIHDATFSEDEADRARETDHSTAREAARVALEAKVARLLMTHISARFSANASLLEEEARALFPQSAVAYDGLSIELGYPQEEGEG